MRLQLGSWLGLASTLRAADTVGQPVALPGIEGLGDEGRGVGEEGKCPIVLRLGLSLLVSLCLWIVNFTCASQSPHP